MRGDRLLSMMLLLQRRGTMTASQIATELGVTTRTVYRDVDALSLSGVPVYTEPGPGGGISLLGKYTTDLTGLSTEEARAVFLLLAGGPLAQLGLGNEALQALAKMSTALPAGRRDEGERTRNRVYLDNARWFQTDAPEMLRTAYRMVMASERMRVTYMIGLGFPVEQTIEPYGLVSKAGEWNLVYRVRKQFRVQEVRRFSRMEPAEAVFQRDPDFDLSAFWHDYCVEYESDRSQYEATLLVSASALAGVVARCGVRRPPRIGGTHPDGRTEVHTHFETLEDARSEVLAFGGSVKVLASLALRKSVEDFGKQIVDSYSEGSASGHSHVQNQASA